jgi:hypothetical protein
MSEHESSADIREQLQLIAESLRHADHLSQDARRRLADLVDELKAAIDADPGATASAVGFHEHVARLALAIQQNHEPGLLETARRKVEETIVSAETEAPVLSGIARRLIRALSDLGI